MCQAAESTATNARLAPNVSAFRDAEPAAARTLMRREKEAGAGAGLPHQSLGPGGFTCAPPPTASRTPSGFAVGLIRLPRMFGRQVGHDSPSRIDPTHRHEPPVPRPGIRARGEWARRAAARPGHRAITLALRAAFGSSDRRSRPRGRGFRILRADTAPGSSRCRRRASRLRAAASTDRAAARARAIPRRPAPSRRSAPPVPAR